MPLKEINPLNPEHLETLQDRLASFQFSEREIRAGLEEVEIIQKEQNVKLEHGHTSMVANLEVCALFFQKFL
jgi:hypothetical protein